MTKTVTVELNKKQVTAIVRAIDVSNTLAKEKGFLNEQQSHNGEQFLKTWQKLLDKFEDNDV